MHLSHARPRPGLLTLIGVVSLIWSILSLVGVFVGCIMTFVLGVASWLGGPVVGSIGSVVALVMILRMVVYSALSILLFQAARMTLRDDPAGLRLHRLWAWISLALAVLGLLASGRQPHSWMTLFYAVGVLYVTGLPEVRAFLGEVGFGKPIKIGKPGGWDEDFA